MPVTQCLLCKSKALELVIDLGMHPLADTFLKKEELVEPEPRYPLQVLLCTECGHVMSSYIVSPEERYQKHDYSYDSGNSKASIEHFGEMAKDIIEKTGVGKDDLVVDIGGSVGTLLMAFSEQAGVRILNVEPAGNIAALAEKNGVPTIQDFFNGKTAEKITTQGGAKVITMTNAFNHIGALDEFMPEIVRCLRVDGVFVIEVPYLLLLVEKLAFDTIYLEHVSYFALKPLRRYLKTFGLVITSVQETEYMGGSVRIFIGKNGEEEAALGSRIEREESLKLFELQTYKTFMLNIEELKRTLTAELTQAKEQGGRIIGIGAATKGNTLLNYCGIDHTLLEFVTDASPLKIGKYTPGSHIPILSDEAITEEITHGLVLPWNIATLLTAKLAPRYPHLAFIVPHMGR